MQPLELFSPLPKSGVAPSQTRGPQEMKIIKQMKPYEVMIGDGNRIGPSAA